METWQLDSPLFLIVVTLWVLVGISWIALIRRDHHTPAERLSPMVLLGMASLFFTAMVAGVSFVLLRDSMPAERIVRVFLLIDDDYLTLWLRGFLFVAYLMFGIAVVAALRRNSS
jgi:hypothetical protein